MMLIMAATVRNMHEYTVQATAFPWRAFVLVGNQNSQDIEETLTAARNEWDILLELERRHPDHWLTKSLLQTRWQSYRGIMTSLEACNYNAKSVAKGSHTYAMISAYLGGAPGQGDIQSHKVEVLFNDMRDAEARGSRKTSAAGGPQLLAVSVRSLEKRQQGFSKVQLADSDLCWARHNGEKISKPMRATLFDPTQACRVGLWPGSLGAGPHGLVPLVGHVSMGGFGAWLLGCRPARFFGEESLQMVEWHQTPQHCTCMGRDRQG